MRNVPLLKSLAFPITVLATVLSGCATAPRPAPGTSTLWPRYTLQAEQVLALNLPDSQRFDASGLLLEPSGELLSVNDRGPQLYRLRPVLDGRTVQPVVAPDCFSAAQMAALETQKNGPYDCEGIARDEQGRLYVCDESERWILRCDPRTGAVDRLPIDWSPVKQFFSRADRNASFEGIAIGGGRLYVANERNDPVILVVDLKALRVIDHFVVRPQAESFLGMLHYSDLSWFEGSLWVLCRQHRCVLAVNPHTRVVQAEFDYTALEQQLEYQSAYPVRPGLMEGLAVDGDSIWLVTDNNGLGRSKAPHDTRPTLLKCRRPDAKQGFP